VKHRNGFLEATAKPITDAGGFQPFISAEKEVSAALTWEWAA